MSDHGPIADGLDHQLDPRVIPLERISGGISFAVFAAGSSIALGVLSVAIDDLPAGWRVLLSGLWFAFALFGAWHAYSWPARTYQHTFYRVDEQGIEIRRGVYWRVVINVPRSRVQHIDVSQGPIERRFGLGTLVVYTAGTDYAKVELSGLEHGGALQIREHLLQPITQSTRAGVPSGADDAV